MRGAEGCKTTTRLHLIPTRYLLHSAAEAIMEVSFGAFRSVGEDPGSWHFHHLVLSDARASKRDQERKSSHS